MRTVPTEHPWRPAGALLRRLAGFAAAAAFTGLLGACASPGPATTLAAASPLLHDDLFSPAPAPMGPDEIFALSPAMRAFLATQIEPRVSSVGMQRALFDALSERGALRIAFDSAVTRTAAQTFEARSGNCLSLVIMTGALARELGLRVHYQDAFLEESWQRNNDLLLQVGHVNVQLGPRVIDTGTHNQTTELLVDFLPPSLLRNVRTREIPESTLVAMFQNNRAVEALVRGNLDEAYAWSRASVRQEPGFLPEYNTLGVIYLRHGNLAQAGEVFSWVLQHDESNTRAMSNLADVLQREGRNAEAQQLFARLARLDPEPPFHYFNLGVEAMKRKDYLAARKLFEREVSRADYYHEFHYWLALADYQLGRLEEAREELALAVETSTSRHEHDLYAAKLSWLSAVRDKGLPVHQ